MFNVLKLVSRVCYSLFNFLKPVSRVSYSLFNVLKLVSCVSYSLFNVLKRVSCFSYSLFNVLKLVSRVIFSLFNVQCSQTCESCRTFYISPKLEEHKLFLGEGKEGFRGLKIMTNVTVREGGKVGGREKGEGGWGDIHKH